MIAAPETFGVAPEIRSRLTLRAGPDDLPRLYPWVEGFAARADLPSRLVFSLQLVLEEAVANAALHGFDPAQAGELHLEARADAGGIVAVLRDNGRPFDPLTEAPVSVPPASLDEAAVGGLGVTLMRRFCQQLSYRRAGDENELTMAFDLTP